MNKIILLEGPDASGKSTLARYFLDIYKGNYTHSTEPKNEEEHPVAHHLASLNFAREWKKFHYDYPTILDRNYLSLIIYSNIFLNDEFISKVEDDINTYSKTFQFYIDKTIICLPPKDLYLKRFEEIKSERAEMYDKMGDCYDAYNDLWEGNPNFNKKITNSLYKKIISDGGLKAYKGFYKYDYTIDGIDIEKFVNSII